MSHFGCFEFNAANTFWIKFQHCENATRSLATKTWYPNDNAVTWADPWSESKWIERNDTWVPLFLEQTPSTRLGEQGKRKWTAQTCGHGGCPTHQTRAGMILTWSSSLWEDFTLASTSRISFRRGESWEWPFY